MCSAVTSTAKIQSDAQTRRTSDRNDRPPSSVYSAFIFRHVQREVAQVNTEALQRRRGTRRLLCVMKGSMQFMVGSKEAREDCTNGCNRNTGWQMHPF